MRFLGYNCFLHDAMSLPPNFGKVFRGKLSYQRRWLKVFATYCQKKEENEAIGTTC